MGLAYQHSTIDPADPAANRLLLASRWPLCIRAPEGVLASTGRWIDIRIADESDLGIILMWVPNRTEACTMPVFHKAVLDALKPLAGTKTLAMGDTNTGVRGLDEEASFFTATEGQWFKDLESHGWTDVWRHRNPSKRQYSYRHHKGAWFRIDQIFATRSMLGTVLDVQYDWGNLAPDCDTRRLSDHAALILDVRYE